MIDNKAKQQPIKSTRAKERHEQLPLKIVQKRYFECVLKTSRLFNLKKQTVLA
jgi:hypothetical protein